MAASTKTAEPCTQTSLKPGLDTTLLTKVTVLAAHLFPPYTNPLSHHRDSCRHGVKWTGEYSMDSSGGLGREELVSSVPALTLNRLLMRCVSSRNTSLRFMHVRRSILVLLHKSHSASTGKPPPAIQQNGFKTYIVLFPTQFSISWEYIRDY